MQHSDRIESSFAHDRSSVGPSIRRIDTNRFGFLSFFVCASMTTAVNAVTATTGPDDASSGAELMTHANCKDADDDGRHAPWTYAAIGAIAAMVGQWAFASSDGSDATSFGYGMACGACGVLALQVAAVRRAVLANAERGCGVGVESVGVERVGFVFRVVDAGRTEPEGKALELERGEEVRAVDDGWDFEPLSRTRRGGGGEDQP